MVSKTYYYGIDAIGSYTNENLQTDYFRSSSELITKRYSYGLSPLLGMIYKLNSRLSIATEISYDLTYDQTVTVHNDPNNPKNNYRTENIFLHTQFQVPSKIIFKIKF